MRISEYGTFDGRGCPNHEDHGLESFLKVTGVLMGLQSGILLMLLESLKDQPTEIQKARIIEVFSAVLTTARLTWTLDHKGIRNVRNPAV